MGAQPDLFAALTPECRGCANLGPAINPGVHYCHGEMTWRLAADRVEGCCYRERIMPRPAPVGNRADALHDLLESPRHDISAKDRKWLRAELRAEARAA